MVSAVFVVKAIEYGLTKPLVLYCAGLFSKARGVFPVMSFDQKVKSGMKIERSVL